MPTIPTVKVRDPGFPGDFIIINQSDYNPAIHELFDGETAPQGAGDGAGGPEGGREHRGRAQGDETGSQGTGEGQSDIEKAVNLREVPVTTTRNVPVLADELAKVTDIELLRELMDADDRGNAKPVYQARLDELLAAQGAGDSAE